MEDALRMFTQGEKQYFLILETYYLLRRRYRGRESASIYHLIAFAFSLFPFSSSFIKLPQLTFLLAPPFFVP